MMISRLLSTLYEKLLGHRLALYTVTLLLIGLSALIFKTVRVSDNIDSMLPDRGSQVVADFKLLQRSPFINKALITIHAPPGATPDSLLANADRLAASLNPKLFPDVKVGPGEFMDGRLIQWILRMLPNLLSSDDLATLDSSLDAAGVQQRMTLAYESLLGMEGWIMKGVVQQDPMALRNIGLRKLGYLNLFPGTTVLNGHFISADGQNALLVANTTVEITDSVGSRKLLNEFSRVSGQVLDNGIEAMMISAHRYTLANADVIRGDLWRVLSFSTVAIAMLFFFFLRSFYAINVFLVPLSVLSIASAVTGSLMGSISAVTIGFGAVLMGITVDYAIHVYFALRHGGGSSPDILGEISRPILYGALTTMSALMILLFSDLPGQRQLAVFSLIGIVTALLLSLIVLPHLLPPGPLRRSGPMKSHFNFLRYRRTVIVCWVATLLFFSWQIGNLNFNGNLRAVNFVPADLAADEAQVARLWGDFRGQTMVWSEGSKWESALEANYRLFTALKKVVPPDRISSIAPLLPPTGVQAENRATWRRFWGGESGKRIQREIKKSGSALGFSENAFEPFYEYLQEPTGPVTPKTFVQVGLDAPIEAMIDSGEEGFGILTLIPDEPEILEMLESLPIGGISYVSQGKFHDSISAAIRGDFSRFIILAFATVAALTIFLFRQPARISAALLPVFSGLIVMFGVMGLIGLEVNIFNVVASILVIGMGVDYGIFMVCKITEGYDHATGRAILISGLTTICGFGALVLGHHPALYSIGITVLLGVGAAVPTALIVLPALFSRRSD